MASESDLHEPHDLGYRHQMMVSKKIEYGPQFITNEFESPKTAWQHDHNLRASRAPPAWSTTATTRGAQWTTA
jgi:hypothetical protein